MIYIRNIYKKNYKKYFDTEKHLINNNITDNNNKFWSNKGQSKQNIVVKEIIFKIKEKRSMIYFITQ